VYALQCGDHARTGPVVAIRHPKPGISGVSKTGSTPLTFVMLKRIFADVELMDERIVAAPSSFSEILPKSPSSMTPVDAPAVQPSP
jgi:hypothetical protein